MTQRYPIPRVFEKAKSVLSSMSALSITQIEHVTYLMNGEPIAIPIICASSDMLFVVPSANDVGVWSFVRIMTILSVASAARSVQFRRSCNEMTHEKAREPRRDINKTKLMATQSNASVFAPGCCCP